MDRRGRGRSSPPRAAVRGRNLPPMAGNVAQGARSAQSVSCPETPGGPLRSAAVTGGGDPCDGPRSAAPADRPGPGWPRSSSHDSDPHPFRPTSRRYRPLRPGPSLARGAEQSGAAEESGPAVGVVEAEHDVASFDQGAGPRMSTGLWPTATGLHRSPSTDGYARLTQGLTGFDVPC